MPCWALARGPGGQSSWLRGPRRTCSRVWAAAERKSAQLCGLSYYCGGVPLGWQRGRTVTAPDILLTHTPQMRRNYYGDRALAGLRQLGTVRLHEADEPLEAEGL